MARPTATYRAIELDVPVAWLGVLGASFAIVPLVLALPSGTAVDRVGEQKVMLIGSGIVLAACAVFAFAAQAVVGLIFASILLGLGHLCGVVGQQALVANSTAQSSYDAAFGHYTFAASLGQALGPFLIVVFGGGHAIPDTFCIFLWTAVLAVLLVGLCLLLPTPTSVTREARSARGSLRSLLRTRGLLRALLVSSIVLAAVDVTLVYFPALGEQ